MSERTGYRIILSRRVAKDLEGIFAFIAKDSRTNAAKVVARILDAIESLKVFPHRNLVEQSGARSIKHPVRSIPAHPYIIFFRVLDSDKVVRVLQVRHGARRRPRRFK